MESCLTTERERETFKDLCRDFLATRLADAPREHLHAIERVMFCWTPTARWPESQPIFGKNGSGHLYADLAARVERIEHAIDETAWAQK